MVSDDAVDLDTLFRIFRDRGVIRVFMKKLASNDNSKNQVYLAGDLSVLGVLPSGDLEKAPSTSARPGMASRQILKAPIRLQWIAQGGMAFPAPNAQLILYPQYPEVRLSGLVRGSDASIGQWFDVRKDGRAPGRTLLLGVSASGEILAHLAPPNAAFDNALSAIPTIASFGALTELEFLRSDSLETLLAELRRIHGLGWIQSKRLDRSGQAVTCRGQNCGGYTLEAELGVIPNGLAEPDYLGWEIKTFSVNDLAAKPSAVITVMTPEPDGGIYREQGAETFVRQFGYPDRLGRADRLNFGGVHKFGQKHKLTGLKLMLSGYDMSSGKIFDVNGGIELIGDNECAASWSFRKLIDHWKRKHEKAAYVANNAEAGPPRRYRYAGSAGLGTGAQFERLLSAVVRGELYYDPGLKLESASTESPQLKRRSQFRIRYTKIKELYQDFRQEPV